MRFYQVDAFADRPFTGNPAAVVALEGPADEEWMQNVAMEMNLSETAFLHPTQDGFNLRWFTPGAEVDLCGHATLASAHILWAEGLLPRESAARFHTRSGLLTAEKIGDLIELDFPAKIGAPTAPPPHLAEALGVQPVEVHQNRMDLLCLLESEEQVRNLKPDIAKLKSVEVRGVIVTAVADPQSAIQNPESGADFVSRFFAPAVGVDEDPVTGSAHCFLAPFWAERLGKTTMIAYQASKRGGWLELQLVADRVKLRGQAVITLTGDLLA